MSPNTPPNTAAFSWLLEPADPGVRYLALRDLLELPPDDPELIEARQQAHTQGPIAVILEQMHPDGYWVEPGPGYLPKYRSTVWAVILLAQLGAVASLDPRLEQACVYLLDHALAPGGQFTADGAPSGTADCLQGNLCWALVELGCSDPRLETAYDWMARSVTGEDIAPASERKADRRYYAGKCGPTFACGSNNKLPCAWGGVKVMLAMGVYPQEKRTSQIERAIQHGAAFLLDGHPAEAGYPNGYSQQPSGNWWKFGFPVFYVTDILQIAEALLAFGFGSDLRLQAALDLIQSKQDAQRRWSLEYDYRGKTWVDFGLKKAANKWVTLRALRCLSRAEAASLQRCNPSMTSLKSKEFGENIIEPIKKGIPSRLKARMAALNIITSH